ncbi:MAG: hypothetical protein AVDCRST_MAG75-780 [uncultured Propionibacteriaceae bacterium]|uniref:PH domain-containing protein n=1 Tax=uncultured Propionibacteriaceae bacterium TaxID=257457 RepID=A0A6J4NC96_9ACTN|nr:MAG: hypothetical protein AVDCRST_MAG75-780 [uncultured Propionibacteriaceae bacterium]
MTSERIEELRVPFDPGKTQERALRWRRLFRGRIITFCITCAIVAALYFWGGDRFRDSGTVVIYAVVIGLSVVWMVLYLLIYLRVKQLAGLVGTGTALCIDRRGVEVAGVSVPWSEVTEIAAAKGRWGRGPQLEVRRTSGDSLRVPFDHMDIRPATLDMTARAYSAGRHGVGLQALDT